MEPNLVDLRAQLRRLRQLMRGDLQSMLTRMQRDCHALASTVQNMPATSDEIAQIQAVVATLNGSVDALVTATLAGTFREFGGPEDQLDELITSGRQPTPEEIASIVQAIDSAMNG